jgi:hypothetical protein
MPSPTSGPIIQTMNQPRPSFTQSIRTMDKRLRTMLLATVLLLVPGIGQFVALHDLATAGKLSGLAVLFEIVTIFFVPTSLILTGAIIMVVRKNYRHNEKLIILGGLNILLAINLIWFFVNACSWAQVFGLAIGACH